MNREERLRNTIYKLTEELRLVIEAGVTYTGPGIISSVALIQEAEELVQSMCYPEGWEDEKGNLHAKIIVLHLEKFLMSEKDYWSMEYLKVREAFQAAFHS